MLSVIKVYSCVIAEWNKINSQVVLSDAFCSIFPFHSNGLLLKILRCRSQSNEGPKKGIFKVDLVITQKWSWVKFCQLNKRNWVLGVNCIFYTSRKFSLTGSCHNPENCILIIIQLFVAKAICCFLGFKNVFLLFVVIFFGRAKIKSSQFCCL